MNHENYLRAWQQHRDTRTDAKASHETPAIDRNEAMRKLGERVLEILRGSPGYFSPDASRNAQQIALDGVQDAARSLGLLDKEGA